MRWLVTKAFWLARLALPLAIAGAAAGAGGALAAPAEAPSAGSWPGLWGPNRDARIAGPLIVGAGARLEQVWRRPIGKGVSEVAVTGGRGFVSFTDGTTDHLMAFDVATGKEIWQAPMAATHQGHGGEDDGPISTPLVDGGRVFSLDPFGKLFAFDQATGRPLWHRDLAAELGGVAPFWGFATAPLPVGKTLVVQAGGAEHNNLVALAADSGQTVWTSQPAKENGYSSPVLLTLGGVRQVVASTSDQLFGVNPDSGAILWTHPAIGEPRQSPVLLPGDRLFVTSWDESAVLQLQPAAGGTGPWKVAEVWRKPVLKANYSPAVYRDGYLYGMNAAFLTCLDPQTGEIKWRERIYDAQLILVGGYLAVLGTRSGFFHLIEATPAGFHEVLKERVFTPGALSMTGPMFIDGRFLLRNDEEMVMLRLTSGDPAAPPAAPGKKP
jgi:outer membrane protein assembly factor BamB